MARDKKRTGAFIATDESGRMHIVHIYTEFISADSTEGSEVLGARQELQLTDGTLVFQLGKGEFEALSPLGKLKLHSDDPRAP